MLVQGGLDVRDWVVLGVLGIILLGIMVTLARRPKANDAPFHQMSAGLGGWILSILLGNGSLWFGAVGLVVAGVVRAFASWRVMRRVSQDKS